MVLLRYFFFVTLAEAKIERQALCLPYYVDHSHFFGQFFFFFFFLKLKNVFGKKWKVILTEGLLCEHYCHDLFFSFEFDTGIES
jgi:hypothetical protein